MNTEASPAPSQQPRRTWRQWSKQARVRIGFVLLLIVVLSLFSWWWPRRGMVSIRWNDGGFMDVTLREQFDRVRGHLPPLCSKLLQPVVFNWSGWLSSDARVQQVYLDSPQSQQIDLRMLSRFSQLHLLSLTGRRLGADLGHLTKLKHLSVLFLSDFNENSDLSVLRQLPHLESLLIGRHPNTGCDYEVLREIPNLKTVYFERIAQSEAVKAIGQCPQVRWLTFANGVIDASSLMHLKGMTGLQSLYFHRCEFIDGEVLSHIAEIENLENLQLDVTTISDNELRLLARLTKLKTLSIGGAGLTQAGIERLQQAMPSCRVSLQSH